MRTIKELSVEAKLENMVSVLEFINEQITNYTNCSTKIQNQISIAIDEIFSNIIKYSYSFEIGIVLVRITVEDDITIEFEDSGIPFNPLAQNNPDISLPLEKRDTGGLGVFIVKNIMDSVEYKYINNKNHLTIKKHLKNIIK